ncbi:GGDEF domain-containing protein [Candidatus Omnitrophota bacterium]
MHLLTFLLVSVILYFLLKRIFSKRLQRLLVDYESTQEKYGLLTEEYRKHDEINSRLSENVRNLVEFYEITKELTRYRGFEEAVDAFSENLKKYIELDDCQFLKPQADQSSYIKYELFPLKINDESMGSLAIQGLRIEDKDKFYILFNQLLLVLKRARLYSKIEELAITDSLTGAYLRRYFQDKLEDEIRRCKDFKLGFVFLMLDLDNFKSYNDRYGHLVGDALLSSVARIMRENLREIDVVARYGGEEFSIILPNTSKEEAEYVSLRLRQAIEKENIRAYDEELHITVSIGASLFPQDAQDAQQLIDKADQALYTAKQAGKNQVRFWS